MNEWMNEWMSEWMTIEASINCVYSRRPSVARTPCERPVSVRLGYGLSARLERACVREWVLYILTRLTHPAQTYDNIQQYLNNVN